MLCSFGHFFFFFPSPRILYSWTFTWVVFSLNPCSPKSCTGECLSSAKSFFTKCCNLTKGYWMRNNQNGGCKWNGNLYNINKIQYSPIAWRSFPQLVVTTNSAKIHYLSHVPPNGRVWHKAFFKLGSGADRSPDTPGGSKNASGPASISLQPSPSEKS